MLIKILIVDDDLEIVRFLGTTFTTLLKDYLVLTATTANAGLNYIKREKPDVIIMDVRLGPKSGMDLLEDYPKYMQDYCPRIIVITAYDDEKAKKKAEELKVDAFLRKPFEQNELLSKVFRSIEACLENELRNVQFAGRAFEKRDEKLERADEEMKSELRKKKTPPTGSEDPEKR